MTRIRFRGEDFLLVGDLNTGGSIATEEQYTTFQRSHAHLLADGRVVRLGQVIGHREDIEVLGECDVAPTSEGIAEALKWLAG